jgi:glycosyltransferase involved in cell wall biosynthesis
MTNRSIPAPLPITSGQPLVSVGVPTYNRPDGLRKMLTCITGQSYKNLEIIVSDNSSTDPQVVEILKEFQKKDVRVRYVVQPENKSAAFNFRFVLNQASGPYYVWAADDDEWGATYIEECLDQMKRHPEISLCYSEAVLRNFKGHPEMIWKSDMSTIDMARLPGIRKVLINQHRNTEFYGLLKTDLVRKFQFRHYFGEDHNFVLFMAMNGKIARVSPGLFVSGIGETWGSSPEKLVDTFGSPSWHRHLGYLILHWEMIKLVFKGNNGLWWYEKPVVAMYVLERIIFVPRFRNAIKDGVAGFVKSILPWALMKKIIRKIRAKWSSLVLP